MREVDFAKQKTEGEISPPVKNQRFLPAPSSLAPAGAVQASNRRRRRLASRRGGLFLFLSLLYELFPAFGAGDGNLALASGNANGLVALGALEVAVLPVLEPVHHLAILPVFLVALVGVLGEAPENHQTQETVGNQGQDHIETGDPDEHGQQTAHHAHTQQGHIQMVVAITAGHKLSQIGKESAEELIEHT